MSNGTITVEALPYAYPFDPARTALVIIDMQRDFIEPGGFGEALGNDVAPLAAIVPVVGELLALARKLGLLVVHTRESHLPDLSDCPPSKLARGNPRCRIGDEGPMGRILIRGEAGNDIVPALRPAAGEIVIDKPGKGAFYDTGLQAMLLANGITHLLFCGVTTEVCVQTSMREANDRGYECLLIEDATASYFPQFKEATLAMVRAQGGIVGWTAPLAALTRALASQGHSRAICLRMPNREETMQPETGTTTINLPEIIAELDAVFEEYEDALVRHDVDALDRFFWYDQQTVRYGVAENLYGGQAIRSYRMAAAPVHPGRRILHKVVTSFGRDFGTVSVEFRAPDSERTGRQMQTWVRFAEGWRVVAAHVSMI